MSNLEKYILHLYGRRVPFKVASRELGFNIMTCVNLVQIRIDGEIKYREKKPNEGDLGSEYLLSRTSVNDKTIDFREFAHLLDLNMHLGVSNEINNIKL